MATISAELIVELPLIVNIERLMPVFSYRAADKNDLITYGTIAGETPRQARELLRSQGLRIVELSPQSASGAKGATRFSIFNRDPSGKVAGFASDLSTLLRAGVPLVESLDTLSEQYDHGLRNAVLHLKEDVASGDSLASSLRNQPDIFDALSVKMVEVGENTGELHTVLRQLAGFKRRSTQFKDRVLTALLYPLIIFVVSIGVTIFIMSVVVPMLLENLIDAGKPLPWPTMVLKSLSDTLINHGWWMAVTAICGAIGATFYFKTDAGSRLWYDAINRFPVLGAMNRKQEIAKVSLIISTLMKSGVEFVDAVRIATGTTSNPLLRDALDQCATSVSSGVDIGSSLDASFFPPMVVQVYTIGQESGHLEDMLEELAEDFDAQVESVAAKLSTTIEPVLILVLSVFVGFILFATLLPILEAGNVLG
ncbi:MAG: type II secretion system F family protein [Planctomycetota bacterium]